MKCKTFTLEIENIGKGEEKSKELEKRPTDAMRSLSESLLTSVWRSPHMIGKLLGETERLDLWLSS